jgi:hypothetical protein
MEQVYIDSARSPLQEYIIKLNQSCLVQIDDSKYKAGRHLWPPLYINIYRSLSEKSLMLLLGDRPPQVNCVVFES